MDLLNLSDEDLYYLVELIKSKAVQLKTECYISSAQSHQLRSLPYKAPLVDDDLLHSEMGLSAKIVLNFGFFIHSLLHSTPIQQGLFPEQKTLTLSHDFLIMKDKTGIFCYFFEKTAFASGHFGSVYHSPIQIKITHDNKVELIKRPLVIKLQIQNNFGPAIEKSPLIINEFNHLKKIHPDCQMLVTKSGPQTPGAVSFFSASYQYNWIIMPKLEGLTLTKFPLSQSTIAQKFKIALSLIQNLIALHNPQELNGEHIHNDIKPDNIIVNDNHIGYFCDFGGASMSREPITACTPIYSKYKKLGQRSEFGADIYSLGLTLFQLFIDESKIPEGSTRWQLFPKGKLEKTSKHWNRGKKLDPTFKPTKVIESDFLKVIYKTTQSTTLIVDQTISGLTKEQTQTLFDTLKGMRSKPPLSLSEAFSKLYCIAQGLENFDANYFSPAENTSEIASAASSGCR